MPAVAQMRTFKFRSRPEAVSAARRALDGFDDRLDAAVFYDASLCISELVTNAVLHAEIGPDDELRLDVVVGDDLLRVTVTDTGRGFAPEEPSPGDESGWGLFIVDRLSHRWGVDRNGTTRVWFEMDVGRSAAALPAARTRPSTLEREVAENGTAHPTKRAAPRLRARPEPTV